MCQLPKKIHNKIVYDFIHMGEFLKRSLNISTEKEHRLGKITPLCTTSIPISFIILEFYKIVYIISECHCFVRLNVQHVKWLNE
jgi:hypothetical protein